MKRRAITQSGTSILLLGLVGLIAWGLCLPAETQAGNLKRLRADYDQSGETSTSLNDAANGGVGGKSLYSRTVTVPTGMNSLYVTISGTGDDHSGAALWLSCNVNGTPCNPGKAAATGLKGWIAMQNPEGDLHDNSFHYAWCAPISPGTPTVEIRMASSNGGTVYVDQLNYFIDASSLPDGNCQSATNGVVGITGNTTGKDGGTVGIQGP